MMNSFKLTHDCVVCSSFVNYSSGFTTPLEVPVLARLTIYDYLQLVRLDLQSRDFQGI